MVFAALIAVGVLGQSQAAPPIESLLTRYASGDIENVAQSLRLLEPSRPSLGAFVRDAERWIEDAAPAERRRRRQVAAAVALELSSVRLTSHWGIVQELLTWGAAELRKEPASTFEEDWLHATIALAGRARSRNWLVTEGHLQRALDRYPLNDHFRLARAVAKTIRGRLSVVAQPQADNRELMTLLDDSIVGAEAAMYAAFLALTERDFEEAIRLSSSAQGSDKDARTVYLAHMIAGQASEAMERPETAIAEYRAAAATLPNQQSAALALVGLLAHSPESATLLQRLDESLEANREDDPWRLLPYGDFYHLPALMLKVRNGLK